MTSTKTFLDFFAPNADDMKPPKVAAYRPTRTPAEVRAESTTRVAREMTDADAERRQTQVAKLRAARLAKEAEETAAAAAPEPKKKRKKAP
jgi:hypothetical protein